MLRKFSHDTEKKCIGDFSQVWSQARTSARFQAAPTTRTTRATFPGRETPRSLAATTKQRPSMAPMTHAFSKG